MDFINEIRTFTFYDGIYEAQEEKKPVVKSGSLETIPNMLSSVSDRVSDEDVNKIDNALDLLVVDRAIDSLIKDPKQREHFLIFQKPETISALKKYQLRIKERITGLNKMIDSELEKKVSSKDNPIQFNAIEKAVDTIQKQNERLRVVKSIYEFYEDEQQMVALDSELVKMKMNQTPFKYTTAKGGERVAVISKIGPYDEDIQQNSVQIKFINSTQTWTISKSDFWSGKTDLDKEGLVKKLNKTSSVNTELIKASEEIQNETISVVSGIKPVTQQKLSDGFNEVQENPNETTIISYLMTLKELDKSVVSPLLKDDIEEARTATLRLAKEKEIDPRLYSDRNISRLTHNRLIKDLNDEIKEFMNKKHSNVKEVQNDYETLVNRVTNETFRKTTLENEDDRDDLLKRLDKAREDKLKVLKGRSYVDDVDFENLKSLQIRKDIDLPMEKSVDLIVNKENRIQDSPLTKFRKAAMSLTVGVLGGGQPLTSLSNKLAAEGEARRKALLSFVNTVATSAASLAGDKAKKQADNMTKNLSYSAYNNKFDVETNESKVEEDMVAQPSSTPGTTAQVPGSTTGMGDPIAPTRDSTGSGDNFNPDKKKKKKKSKKKKQNEDRVFSFADYVKKEYKK